MSLKHFWHLTISEHKVLVHPPRPLQVKMLRLVWTKEERLSFVCFFFFKEIKDKIATRSLNSRSNINKLKQTESY